MLANLEILILSLIFVEIQPRKLLVNAEPHGISDKPHWGFQCLWATRIESGRSERLQTQGFSLLSEFLCH